MTMTMTMTERSQQDLLQDLKDALGGTWDDVAIRTQIAVRALKSYRLPSSSKGYRGMDKFVRKAVEDALSEVSGKGRKSA
jgi:hypothetical protein